MTFNDDTEKREIYVIGDLHLGGKCASEVKPYLDSFVQTLAKIAEKYVHTVVLLGDIFEMWMTPVAVTPPTKQEYVAEWKNDQVIVN